MRHLTIIAIACALLTACATANVKLATEAAKPGPTSRILLVKPDVELSLLTVSGLAEPKADWTLSATENLSAKVGDVLKGKGKDFATFDPEGAMGGRGGQILRLNEAVDASIAQFTYGPVKLPSKGDGLDWTLGDGAAEIGRESHADYALFILARGSYSSGGRVAVAMLGSLAGLSVPLGSQSAVASLVDLKTGRVVWFSTFVANASTDMRNDTGTKNLVEALLKDIPL